MFKIWDLIVDEHQFPMKISFIITLILPFFSFASKVIIIVDLVLESEQFVFCYRISLIFRMIRSYEAKFV